jgi:hypothetical protein
MQARDAIAFLAGHFTLSAVDTGAEGEMRYHFERPFRFVVTEIDTMTIALFAALEVPADLPADGLLRRMLEANLQGVETGAGSMCRDEGGRIGYRDVIDLRLMRPEGLQLRFIDFSLYFDFWRAEGLPRLIEDLRRDEPPGDGFLKL